MIYLISAFLAVSLFFNVFLYLKLKKPKKLSQDAKILLKELMSGDALVRIEVVDKENIFLRSPKDIL